MSSASRNAVAATEARSAADLVIASVLAQPEHARLADPVAFVAFLRDSFEPVSYSIEPLAPEPPEPTLSDLRFRTLVEQLGSGAPALRRDEAVRIAGIVDELMDDRTPFERPVFAADAGLHARMASSFARKGRILAAVVRFMRVTAALEIGTAYGVSALFLAASLERADGKLTTLERSEPQLSIAQRVLSAEHPERVRVLGGISTEVRAGMEGDSFDFLFHDGEHSEAAYVDDFTAFEPSLDPGAVVLFDDIRWEDPWSDQPARTYEGWRRVVAHPRVRQAVEIDDSYGLILLG